MQGEIKYWKADKGYGFIGIGEDQNDVFVHITELPYGWIPYKGDLVEFDVMHDELGRARAMNVQVIHSETRG